MKTMTELTVADVMNIVSGHLAKEGMPLDWYVFDTPENVARIWKTPPAAVRMNNSEQSSQIPIRQTTRMPLNYPTGGKESVERPPVPQSLLTPKMKVEENKDGTVQSKMVVDKPLERD